ncbi:MAG TPA: hypothetical protein VG455_01990 [Acidimicrobiales bacterium]|nr:hypothetical protein [Acidimicrobiales bacterium]
MDEIKRGYLEAAGLRDLPAPETLTVPIDNPGHPLHFSFASHDMLVVAQHIGELIERMSPGDVERIPVRVEGRNEPYEILNVLTRIACIDRDRTVGELWPDASERAGEYRMIVRLALDPDRVPESIRIFQVGGWKVSVVVTEDLKEALEDATGLTFKPTAPPR